jgi:probable addiction module antidote protein
MKKQKQDLSKAKDIFEEYAQTIKDNPKKMKEFETAINDVYDQTGDIYVLLAALRVIAAAKGNISALSRQTNIQRRTIYNAFKNGANPTFQNVNAIAKGLGVKIRLSFQNH